MNKYKTSIVNCLDDDGQEVRQMKSKWAILDYATTI